MDFYQELIKTIKEKNPTKEQLNKIKIKLCKKYKVKKIPTDIQIYSHSKESDKIRLVTKPTRTISGVAVIAIMTSAKKCPHGKCIYCPGGPKSEFGNVPQSYTGKEPATMRAQRNKFDAYLQIFNRLEQYILLGQIPEKIELIVMGGTFPSFEKKYKEEFIYYSFRAMNDFSDMFFKKKIEKNKEEIFDFEKFKKFFEIPCKDISDKKRLIRLHKKILELKQKKKSSLEKEQEKNENSKIKCVGLTIETRPDYGMLKEGNEILSYGCTRVELGVQTTDEKIMKFIERGHSVKDSIKSTQILKDLGFKINYHLMPGLPGSSLKKDLEMMKEIFSNSEFRPDMLKIYPCMVVKGTKLYELYHKGKFKPIATKQAAELIAEFKTYVPRYCRIMRVQRDIPSYVISSGVDRTNLRQYIDEILKKRKIKCECIRCREAGIIAKKYNLNAEKIELIVEKYEASKGTEYFISMEDKKQNILLGFCRLRFPYESLRKEITKDSALIRELHVYGEMAGIGKKGDVQHRGIGRELLMKAEEIAKQNKKDKIVVISGVGVRNYYRKFGYEKEGFYMVKKID
jgi:elongator complex protein 3